MRYIVGKEMMIMEKTATLNLRVDPSDKKNAEYVLSQLGISMSSAVNVYLKQIALTGGIPFPVSLPKAPASVDAEKMSAAEIRSKISDGINDVKSGETIDAKEAFDVFKNRR